MQGGAVGSRMIWWWLRLRSSLRLSLYIKPVARLGFRRHIHTERIESAGPSQWYRLVGPSHWHWKQNPHYLDSRGLG